MICLRDYVGPYRGCDAPPAAFSGLYLDQLPGIDFQNIDQVATADQVDWAGLWDDLQTTALDTFREDVIEEFSKRYMLKQITQSVDLGKGIDTSHLTAPVGGTDYGLLVETTLDSSSQFSQSSLMNVYFETVSFYYVGATSPAVFTIDIKDADTNVTLYTTTVSNAVQGWNTVRLEQEFDSNRIYVFVSGNFTDYAKKDITNFQLDFYGNTLFGGWNGTNLGLYWGGWGCGARIRGVTKDGSTVSPGTNTFGVSAEISSRCSFDKIVCGNKRHFASVWQHCLAIELLNYRINSTRLNRWTTINKDQAVKLQSLYTLKYRGGIDKDTGLTYPGKLRSSIESIKLNLYDCCITSNDYMQFIESKV